MKTFDFKNNNATKEELLEILTLICNEAELASSDFEKLWKGYLLKIDFSATTDDIEILNLCHDRFRSGRILGGNILYTYFDISSIINDLNKYQYLTFNSNDSDFKYSNVHFPDTEYQNVDTEFKDRSSALAVFMPQQLTSDETPFEIIDGNHRVSAANNSGIAIPVACIMQPFLPQKAFISESNFAIYNMWAGAALIQAHLMCGDSESVDQYLNQLDRLLLG